jgi:CHAT domain-containing protein
VRTLVLSLWSVGDEETRRWMQAFYEAKLARKLDTGEAVRAATLERLAAAREQGRDDPATWGAFIAVDGRR